MPDLKELFKPSDKKRKLPTPMMLFMRVLVGGYLVYTSYEVYVGTKTDGNPGAFFIICAVVFAIVGAVAVVLGLRELIKGRYAGGPLDISDEEGVVDAPEVIDEGQNDENLTNN